MPAPPIRCSVKVNEWLPACATARSTFTASSVTSRPTPSPGSTTMRASRCARRAVASARRPPTRHSPPSICCRGGKKEKIKKEKEREREREREYRQKHASRNIPPCTFFLIAHLRSRSTSANNTKHLPSAMTGRSSGHGRAAAGGVPTAHASIWPVARVCAPSRAPDRPCHPPWRRSLSISLSLCLSVSLCLVLGCLCSSVQQPDMFTKLLSLAAARQQEMKQHGTTQQRQSKPASNEQESQDNEEIKQYNS